MITDENRRHCQSAGLDPERIPRHLAIIMDGNGRWAKSRGWERVLGHQKGGEAVRTATTRSSELGVGQLTLYAFSSENWKRPQREIDALMRLLANMLRSELPTLIANQIRLTAIGHVHRLTADVQRVLAEAVAATATHRRMTLTLAVSYGGRDELVDAVRSISEQVRQGRLDPAAITVETVQAHLYDPGAADVDVVIRTAGEHRLSNFLPWQTVYAEYISVPAYWPDFNAAALDEVLREYQRRDRRFGGVH